MLRTRSMTDSSTVMYIVQVSACSSVCYQQCWIPCVRPAQRSRISALSPSVQIVIPRVRREERKHTFARGRLRAGSTPLHTRHEKRGSIE